MSETMDYFVILMTTPPAPIVNDDGNVKYYDCEDEALEDLEEHMGALAFGYEIFCLGEGSAYQGAG